LPVQPALPIPQQLLTLFASVQFQSSPEVLQPLFPFEFWKFQLDAPAQVSLFQ
jgi:hypothetical protein